MFRRLALSREQLSGRGNVKTRTAFNVGIGMWKEADAQVCLQCLRLPSAAI
jgi:hypothetical protein